MIAPTAAGITAAGILRQLDAHRLGAQMQALAALDAAHQAEVRRELQAVRPGARIDLGRLIDSVHHAVAERAAKQPDQAALFRYSLTLKSIGELADMEADLARRADDGEGDEPFEPEPSPTFRPSGPRRPIDGEIAPAATTLAGMAENAPGRAPRPPERPAPAFVVLGGASRDRPLGAPEGCDYAAWRDPPPPPWLLAEDDETECVSA